jgi:hypothetical protein
VPKATDSIECSRETERHTAQAVGAFAIERGYEAFTLTPHLGRELAWADWKDSLA